MVEQTLIEELIGAIKQDPKMRNRTHSAVVARVDDEGVVWVYVAGSDQETPTATTSAEVKRGDGVMVEWRNDRLYIVGNTTDPSAGKARVRAVEDAAAKAGAAASRALTAAASAEESAETAATAAAKAVEDAEAAGRAATEADRKAVAAGRAADGAQKSAEIAQESAHNASEYAARALGNLSTVQSVTETLNWITTHGTMTKTDDYAPSTDTEVVEGKKYYSRSGSGTAQDPYVYTLISNPTGDPSASGYYEGVLDPTHVYFVQDNAGDYEVAGVRYAIVTEPKVEDIADYYVLSIDESLNNYVATHLALLNDGLYVMADDSEWKVKIADNGVFILDPNNKAANSMMANKNIIGYEDQMHVEVDTDSLDIFDDDGRNVASFGSDGAIIGVRENPGDTNVIIGKDGFEVWGKARVSPLAVYSIAQIKSIKTQIIAQDIKRNNFMSWSVELPSSPIQDTQITVRCGVEGTNFNINFTAGVAEEKSFVSYDGDRTISHEANQQIPVVTYEYVQYYIDRFGDVPIFIFGSRGKTLFGNRSSTFGWALNASQEDQFAIGKYNDNKTDTAFEIGNGKYSWGTEQRSNALTVDWKGNIETALDTTAAAGTIDGDLYAAITALGWESEVID